MFVRVWMQLTFMMWCNVNASSSSASTTAKEERGGLTGLKITGKIGDWMIKVGKKGKTLVCQSVACTHTATSPVLNLICSIGSR